MAYSRGGSRSLLRNILVGFGISGAIGPIHRLVEAVLTEGVIAGAVSAGLAAVLITVGTALVYDDDELDEAVEILRLKGAPIVD